MSNPWDLPERQPGWATGWLMLGPKTWRRCPVCEIRRYTSAGDACASCLLYARCTDRRVLKAYVQSGFSADVPEFYLETMIKSRGDRRPHPPMNLVCIICQEPFVRNLHQKNQQTCGTRSCMYERQLRKQRAKAALRRSRNADGDPECKEG